MLGIEEGRDQIKDQKRPTKKSKALSLLQKIESRRIWMRGKVMRVVDLMQGSCGFRLGSLITGVGVEARRRDCLDEMPAEHRSMQCGQMDGKVPGAGCACSGRRGTGGASNSDR